MTETGADVTMLGARFTSVGTRAVQADKYHSTPPLAGISNNEAEVIKLGEKMGAIGLEPTTSRM